MRDLTPIAPLLRAIPPLFARQDMKPMLGLAARAVMLTRQRQNLVTKREVLAQQRRQLAFDRLFHGFTCMVKAGSLSSGQDSEQRS
jgi:hypothetical protein